MILRNYLKKTQLSLLPSLKNVYLGSLLFYPDTSTSANLQKYKCGYGYLMKKEKIKKKNNIEREMQTIRKKLLEKAEK